MPKTKRPRRGSLQIYPRKRARKLLPSANWAPVSRSNHSEGLLGFIVYKVGMVSVLARDNAEKSSTKGKSLVIPATILEAPDMRIFSIRFYKAKKVIKDLVVSNDKELKKKLKVPKQLKNFEENIPKDYDKMTLVVYSIPKQTSIKKRPDIIEIAFNAEDKIEFAKKLIGKEITLTDFLRQGQMLFDVHGLTKGKGIQGPVKRFGITLRFHKSEKGVRKVGSIGPWHPARVTFRTPMAGQTGFFTRTIHNLHMLSNGHARENNINPKQGFKNYGKINTSYIILNGSVPGAEKRQLLITLASRPSHEQSRKKFEFLEVLV